MSLPEPLRASTVLHIVDLVGSHVPDLASALRDEVCGQAGVPIPDIAIIGWNSDRLQTYLTDIDSRIAAGNYDGAVTLCYTCVEGFLKAFLRTYIKSDPGPLEIISAGRLVQTQLRQSIPNYPDEALRMINHICHTLDRTRNKFSESHFDGEASRWLAIFTRDLANSLIRLLLHFTGHGEGE